MAPLKLVSESLNNGPGPVFRRLKSHGPIEAGASAILASLPERPDFRDQRTMQVNGYAATKE